MGTNCNNIMTLGANRLLLLIRNVLNPASFINYLRANDSEGVLLINISFCY